MWRILIVCVVVYLAITLLTFLMQRKLLYLPDRSSLSEEQASVQGLRHWPSQQQFRGFVPLHPGAEPIATVVVFHGNAGAAHHRRYYLDALAPLGFRVVLAAYPGYGGRAGSPSETVLVDDAVTTLRDVHDAHGGRLFVWGESLGAGVAAAAVAQAGVPIEGVVLLTPWDSLANVAQTHYPYLPARWLVLDRFNSIDNLRDYTGRVAVVLAEHDAVIPVKHGKRLFDALTRDKKLWVLDGATHNTVPFSPGQAWLSEVSAYVLRSGN